MAVDLGLDCEQALFSLKALLEAHGGPYLITTNNLLSIMKL